MPTKKSKQKYYTEMGKEISEAQFKQKDKDLEKSITGYKGYKSAYQMQKEQDAADRKAEAEAARQKRIAAMTPKPSARDNTRVVTPIGYKKNFKTGGVVSKKSSAKKFAALAPPYDKATAADRIAGAKGAKPKMKKISLKKKKK
jgi:hypothetical protein